MNGYVSCHSLFTPLLRLLKQGCLQPSLSQAAPVGVRGSLRAVSVLPTNCHRAPRPPPLFSARTTPGQGRPVCGSLAEHLMVGSAIIVSHPSVNNHYCLLTSPFMRSTARKVVFFPCFPCGALFYRPALHPADAFCLRKPLIVC